MINEKAPISLNDLIKLHPEWADLPIVVYSDGGGYEWLGGSAMVYTSKANPNEESEDVSKNVTVLVFTGN